MPPVPMMVLFDGVSEVWLSLKLPRILEHQLPHLHGHAPRQDDYDLSAAHAYEAMIWIWHDAWKLMVAAFPPLVAMVRMVVVPSVELTEGSVVEA